ncbi:hypothetical protein J6590_011093 [Homalodisca vitripennis]|nr:hypothetical protein J6590_011093 [Homalodisca vitripennis]
MSPSPVQGGRDGSWNREARSKVTGGNCMSDVIPLRHRLFVSVTSHTARRRVGHEGYGNLKKTTSRRLILSCCSIPFSKGPPLSETLTLTTELLTTLRILHCLQQGRNDHYREQWCVPYHKCGQRKKTTSRHLIPSRCFVSCQTPPIGVFT